MFAAPLELQGGENCYLAELELLKSLRSFKIILLQLLGAKDPFTHAWSLSVEMQWYFLLPLIFLGQKQITNWRKVFFTGQLISSYFRIFLSFPL